jgi:hypothetical protein
VKKLWLILALVLWCVPAGATDYCADGNVKACWRFTDGSGTTLTDNSSNGNNCAFDYTYTPTWSAMSGTGAPSYASNRVYFSGATGTSAQKIVCADTASLNVTTASITLGSWINADSSVTNNDYISWIFHTDLTSAASYALSYEHKSLDGPKVSIFTSTWYETPTTSWNPTAGTWSHVYAVYNGSTLKIYGDGVEKGSINASGNLANVTGGYVKTYIGGDGASGNAGFKGYLSETSIFDRVLSSTEINDIKDNGLSPSGPSIHTTILRNAVIRNAVVR